jgi:hypothetical protein
VDLNTSYRVTEARQNGPVAVIVQHNCTNESQPAFALASTVRPSGQTGGGAPVPGGTLTQNTDEAMAGSAHSIV